MGWETSEAGGFELGPMIHTSPSPPDLGGTRGSVQQWAEDSHDRVKRLSHIVHLNPVSFADPRCAFPPVQDSDLLHVWNVARDF